MGFAIIDLEGVVLSPQERELLQHPQVAGVILFTRNYENPSQLRSLIQTIKKIRPLFVAVDQEGGVFGDFIEDLRICRACVILEIVTSTTRSRHEST